MLPVMRSDIMLRYKDKCLIIDAKFYKNTLHNYYDTKKIHSTNLYQIFTYVKNQQLNLKRKQYRSQECCYMLKQTKILF